MFKRNGVVIDISQDLVIGEGVDAITVPAASLRDAATRQQYGIESSPDYERPDERLFHITQNLDGSYNAIPKDKSLITDAIWLAIKEERDARKAGGVKLNGYWFHSDDPSRIQYSILDSNAARLNKSEDTVLHPEWKTMTGEKIPMTVGILRQIIDLGIILEGSVFDTAELHKAAMVALDNPYDYDYHVGWPTTYTDEHPSTKGI